MTSAGRSLFLFFAAGVLIAACGGAAPDAQAPKASYEPEPMTVEEAQAQIARAEAVLGGAPGANAASDSAAPPPPPPAASPTSSLPPPSVATGSPAKPDAPRGESKKSAPAIDSVESQCASPCRALASMRRAVSALCRMTGDEDARCRDARKTLQSSEARVTPCSC